jgi:hypothetical protein
MALEWRRRPILTAADDKVGRGQRLELHGEEGNLISGSRESRSSPGDQSMMATIRVEGISGDVAVWWSGRPTLGHGAAWGDDGA